MVIWSQIARLLALSSQQQKFSLILMSQLTTYVCVYPHRPLCTSVLFTVVRWDVVFLAWHIPQPEFHDQFTHFTAKCLGLENQAFFFWNQILGFPHGFLPEGREVWPLRLAPELWSWATHKPWGGAKAGAEGTVSSLSLVCGQTERICFHTSPTLRWAWERRLVFVTESQDGPWSGFF